MNRTPAFVTAAALILAVCAEGCFRELGRYGDLLGTQGYTPRARLFFQKWRARVTDNEAWDYKPLEHAVPAVNEEGDRVFVGGRGGLVQCLDVRRGTAVWSVRLGREIRSELIYRGGVVFVGAADGHLYALDAERGSVNWKYYAKAEIQARPFVTDDRVVFATADHAVYSLDRDTGQWRWSYNRSIPEGFTIQGQGGVTIHKGTAYVGFADGFLVALKAKDGALLWEKKLSDAPRFSDVDSTPAVAGKNVLVSAFSEGLFALDPDDGLIRWKIPARGASSPAVAGDAAYFTTPGGEVVAFDVRNGKTRWRRRVADNEGHLSDAIVYKRFVLFSMSQIKTIGTEGGVWVLDRQSGDVVAVIDLGPGVHGKPIVRKGNLFFLTDSGLLYAYRLARPRL